MISSASKDKKALLFFLKIRVQIRSYTPLLLIFRKNNSAFLSLLANYAILYRPLYSVIVPRSSNSETIVLNFEDDNPVLVIRSVEDRGSIFK